MIIEFILLKVKCEIDCFLILQERSDSVIYERIKKICKEQGLSIAHVEASAGLSNGVIRKWNDSVPSALNLKSVADVLKVPIDVLLEDE